MEKKKLSVLMIGAHPDDCDTGCGATAIKLSREGHRVRFVSMTDGSAGHQSLGREELAAIRRREAQEAGAVAGIEYEVLGYPDGELEVTLESRSRTLRLIRAFDPDVIITHRTIDYHPDHRYTAQLVQDASYLVMVPNICPDTPALTHQPAIFFMSDEYKKPLPLKPDVAVRVDDVYEQKLRMVSCHRSQFFDWLPWMARVRGVIPQDYDDSRYAKRCVDLSDAYVANTHRRLLLGRYGADAGAAVRYAEAFEISEFGGSMDRQAINECFPL